MEPVNSTAKFLINNKLIVFQENEFTADALNTNDDFAIHYIERAIANGYLEQFNIAKTTPISTLDISRVPIDTVVEEVEETQEEATFEAVKPEIWSGKGKPSSEDKKATELMLQLRLSDKYNKLFSDKKTVKMNIWNRIAQELISAGFSLQVKDAGKKCYQKFLNLTKQYINFRKNAEKTGMDKKDPPDFYDLLHAILGDKHKINIQNIHDSLPMDSIDSEATLEPTGSDLLRLEENNDLQEDITSEINSPRNSQNILSSIDNMQEAEPSCSSYQASSSELPSTKKVKSTIRPEKNNKQDLISVIKNMHKENLAQFKCYEEQIKKQNDLLEKQTEQNERMISILEKLNEAKRGKNYKKRRHSSSSES